MPTTVPAAAEDLRAVMASCEFAHPASAAVFLASPTWMLPASGWGKWRERAAGRPDVLTERVGRPDLAETTATLARAAHRDGDLYLDLRATVSHWFKLHPFGTGVAIHGPDILWDSRPLRAEGGLGHDHIQAFLEAWLPERAESAGVVATKYGLVAMEPAATHLVLHRLDLPGQ